MWSTILLVSFCFVSVLSEEVVEVPSGEENGGGEKSQASSVPPGEKNTSVHITIFTNKNTNNYFSQIFLFVDRTARFRCTRRTTPCIFRWFVFGKDRFGKKVKKWSNLFICEINFCDFVFHYVFRFIRWIVSEAKKVGVGEEIAKYDGKIKAWLNVFDL